jgi:tRNA pseudouridine55 synthase
VNKPRRPPRRQVDGVLLLDKPAGMTSNAALQKARWLFNAAKAGHTGTLDPMATGLLPLCFGEATKFAGELLDADKSYRATLKLGVTTDSADADGQVLQTRPVAVNQSQLEAALAAFRGEIEQIPPMYSALKRDGKPLYEYARAGIEVERQPRQVRIDRLDLLDFTADRVEIDVDCSKGTYIRTLAADIGERLGCGAHLVALRRTRIGNIELSEAIALSELETLSVSERDVRLAAPDALLAGLPRIDLDPASAARLQHGQEITWPGPSGSRFRLYSDGCFFGLAVLIDESRLQPQRLLATHR